MLLGSVPRVWYIVGICSESVVYCWDLFRECGMFLGSVPRVWYIVGICSESVVYCWDLFRECGMFLRSVPRVWYVFVFLVIHKYTCTVI
jgi:hypothetical protein